MFFIGSGGVFGCLFNNDYAGTYGVHIRDREVELSRAVCEHCRIIFNVTNYNIHTGRIQSKITSVFSCFQRM